MSFDSLFHFFGRNIHVDVINFAEAAEMSSRTIIDMVNGETAEIPCAGVIIAPGLLDCIIPAAQLAPQP